MRCLIAASVLFSDAWITWAYASPMMSEGAATTTRLRIHGAIILIALIGAVGLAMPARVAAFPQQVTITMSADPQTSAYGVHVTLRATVTADAPADDGSQPHGTVIWSAGDSQGGYEVGRATLVAGDTHVLIDSTWYYPGEHQLGARFVSDDVAAYASAVTPAYTITVGKAPTTTTIMGPTTVELHGSLALTANLRGFPMAATPGSFKFFRVGDAAGLCATTVIPNATIDCTIAAEALGTFGYYASYAGDNRDLGSTSDVLNVTTTPVSGSATPGPQPSATPRVTAPSMTHAGGAPSSRPPAESSPSATEASPGATEASPSGLDATTDQGAPATPTEVPATPPGSLVPTSLGSRLDLTSLLLAIVGIGLLAGLGIRLAPSIARRHPGLHSPPPDQVRRSSDLADNSARDIPER